MEEPEWNEPRGASLCLLRPTAAVGALGQSSASVCMFMLVGACDHTGSAFSKNCFEDEMRQK